MRIFLTLRTSISNLQARVLERRAVAAVLLLYALFQANAALHHGSWGQDFTSHLKWISAARSDPWGFLIHPAYRPEPPLFHLLCAVVFHLTEGREWVETIAFVSILANLLGLLLAYRLICRLVNDPVLRLSCLVFVTFLPVMMIHEVVLASDAFTLPIFLGILDLLSGLVESGFSNAFWPRLLGIFALLLVGVETKYTFGSQAIALFGILCLSSFVKLLGERRAVQALATAGIAGGLTLAIVFQVRGNFGLNNREGAMAWRDILLPHARDVHVLSAPKYDERLLGNMSLPVQYELLTAGRYSYPALVHLAIFTDIMNIYQDDPADSYFGQRTRANQSRMRLAVKTGLGFSLFGLCLGAIALSKTFYLTLVKRAKGEMLRFAVALCGLGWFLNIVVFLPVVRYAYLGGYWLPRLILPSLLAFIIISFAELDRCLVGKSSRWSWGILTVVLLQSTIQLSFLWPHGFARP